MDILERENLQIGDYAVFYIENTRATGVGKIENINVEDGLFTYGEFVTPNNAKGGRKAHHGSMELIKTDKLGTEKLTNIKEACEVLKLKEYIERPVERRKENKIYVYRQYYDSKRDLFRPDILHPDCFCHKILNPDIELISCPCERLYHVECISDESCICDNCGIDMLNDGRFALNLESKKRNPAFKESLVSLRKKNTEFNFSEIRTPGVLPIPEPDTEQPIYRRVNAKRLLMLTDKKKSEISKKVAQKASNFLETFKQSMQLSSQIPESERIRQKIRENFFFGLVLGFEEIRIKNKTSEIDINVQGNASSLVDMNAKQQMDYVKSLTLQLESNLFHLYHKEGINSQEYTKRARLLSMNIKHPRNFDLRMRILTNQVKMSNVCSMDEDELAPRDIRDEREQQQQLYMSSRMIKEEKTMVSKSRKGELELAEDENIYAPPIAMDGSLAFTVNKAPDTPQDKNVVISDSNVVSDNHYHFVNDKDKEHQIEKKHISELLLNLTYESFASKAKERLQQYLPESIAADLIADIN